MKVKVKYAGKMRRVEVVDRLCPHRSCFHPHDCPVQGAGGVRQSEPRWMCLTNAMRGCPDPKPEPNKGGAK